MRKQLSLCLSFVAFAAALSWGAPAPQARACGGVVQRSNGAAFEADRAAHNPDRRRSDLVPDASGALDGELS